jgi:hypothetical protein
MANYYGSARTNYFPVRDEAAAEAWAKRWGFEMCRHNLKPGLFCFLSEHEGGWPDAEYDDDGEQIDGPSLDEQFSEIAAPDEIVIMMEAGAEKLRYLVGYATAIRNGETIQIGLNDIYQLAKAKWGVEPTKAQW